MAGDGLSRGIEDDEPGRCGSLVDAAHKDVFSVSIDDALCAIDGGLAVGSLDPRRLSPARVAHLAQGCTRATLFSQPTIGHRFEPTSKAKPGSAANRAREEVLSLGNWNSKKNEAGWREVEERGEMQKAGVKRRRKRRGGDEIRRDRRRIGEEERRDIMGGGEDNATIALGHEAALQGSSWPGPAAPVP